MIRCFKADGDRLQWKDDSCTVDFSVSDLDSALDYPSDGVVLALVGPGSPPPELVAFDAVGRTLFRVGAPPGWKFYYLTRHSQVSPVVVCISTSNSGAFTDWHFAVDAETGELSKHCPAY